MEKILLFLLISLPLTLFAQKPTQKSQKPAPKPSSTAPTNRPSATAAKPNSSPTTPTAFKKDSLILKMFDQPSDIKWVKTFKGRLDDAAVVDLVLGFDGRNCRGYLTYAQSRIRFNLSGILDSAGFALEERDLARGLTGRLIGTYQNRQLVADWTNIENAIGSRLEAEEVAPGQSMTMQCSDNKWSSRYITRFNGARCDMVLVRTHNGGLDGFLWVESDGRTYRLKGELKTNGDYEMEVLTAGDRLAALLSGQIKPGQNTVCNWVGSGEQRKFNFILKDHFLLGCYEYADYATSYDVLYPRTPCSHCNTQLDEQINQWVARCQSTYSEKKTPLTPATRGSQRASAWPEIACWTDNVFSGYVTFADTWTAQAAGISFNFNIKTNKEITLDDLFNKGFDAQKYMNDWARREMPKLADFAQDAQYREWLSKEGFPLFALRREGFEISSLFHPQYGRQTLLIPYSELKTYLRKDAPVGEFLK